MFFDVLKFYQKYFPLNNFDQTIYEANKNNFQKLKKTKKTHLLFFNKTPIDATNVAKSTLLRNGYNPLMNKKQLGKISCFPEDWKKTVQRDQTQRKTQKKEKIQWTKFLGDIFLKIFKKKT